MFRISEHSRDPGRGRYEVSMEVRVDAHMTLKNPVWSFLSLKEQTKVSLIEISLFF